MRVRPRRRWRRLSVRWSPAQISCPAESPLERRRQGRESAEFGQAPLAYRAAWLLRWGDDCAAWLRERTQRRWWHTEGRELHIARSAADVTAASRVLRLLLVQSAVGAR